MPLTLVTLGLNTLASLSVVEYATIAGSVIAVATVLRESLKEIRARLNGSRALEKNALEIYRHAFNYKVIEGYINRVNGPRSVLIETPGRIYYALKDKDPSIAILEMSNKEDVAKYQKMLVHLDNPEKLYNIAMGKLEENDHSNSDICIKERKEWDYKLRDRGWLKKISGSNPADVDKAMHMHVEVLIETKNTAPNMSANCHLGIRHGNGDKYDIIVNSISKKFTKAVKKSYNKTVTELAKEGDTLLFSKILEVRRSMSGYIVPTTIVKTEALKQ